MLAIEHPVSQDKDRKIETGVSDPRFQFGENWARFLSCLNEKRIVEAENCIKEMLEVESLAGMCFLDAGSGSGLFSLAAIRLGAERVISFDYDPQSVACAYELKRRYFPDSEHWIVQQGDVLDKDYLQALGTFDVVYSWGVLHHTGNMWQALANVVPLVRPEGKLFVAIYNDQESASRYWSWIKRTYVKSPRIFRYLILFLCLIRLWGPATVRDLFRGKPFFTWKNYSKNRGMSPWCDVVDWVGGYPFQVAKPEEIFNFYKKYGFSLSGLKTCAGGHDCNEFVFVKR